ncbi:hypothetical protein GCM10010464_75300 [Pseudonocardia yunnanensis]|uniref:Uncharacterized protein n=1 Tax=Pseudonocardia yunnanensis TaxID=58107 RepID=A0ABW4F829_9PSEU
MLAQIARNEQPMERTLDMAMGRAWAYAAATADPRSADVPRRPTPCGYDRADKSCFARPAKRSTPALLRQLLSAGTLGRHDHVCRMVRAREQDVRIELVRQPATDGVGGKMATQPKIIETSARTR